MSSLTHQTRREAHEKVSVADHRMKVLGVILSSSVPLGASQIADALVWDVTSVRPRCTELLKAGQIVAVGKRKLETGRSEAVFAATPVHSFEQETGQGMFSGLSL